MKEYDLEIIAGPCSFNLEKAEQYYRLSEIMVNDGSGGTQPALLGTRVVGLKSRSDFPLDSFHGGSDFEFIEQVVIGGETPAGLPPSISFARDLNKDTGLLIATEIMMPDIQLPLYEKGLPNKSLIAWSPSVNQLGWTIWQTAQFVKKHGWYLGIKNGKWLDIPLAEANNPQMETITSLQKTWTGLASYAREVNGHLILIHRGVDVPQKGNYRNPPVHEIARRAKKSTRAKLYLDPSHICGPQRRNDIVTETVKAMMMKDNNDWLYDGILAEVGESLTDTYQHMTVDELDNLVRMLADFRKLRPPNKEQ